MLFDGNIRSDGVFRLQRADSLEDGDGGVGSATSLVRRTADLAAEVAGLARQLEQKQARLQKNQVIVWSCMVAERAGCWAD
jgi:hypothetical protein